MVQAVSSSAAAAAPAAALAAPPQPQPRAPHIMPRPSRSLRAPGEWWADNTARTVGQVDEEGLPLGADEAHILCGDDPESEKGKAKSAKYLGTISELADGRYTVHYVGWAKRYDETISAERLRVCAPEWAAREARKRGQRAADSTPSPPSQKRRGQQRRAPATAAKAPQRPLSPAAALRRALEEVDRLVWGTLASSSGSSGRDAVHRAYELLCEHAGAAALGRGRATDLAVAAAEVGHVACLRLVYERADAAATCRADTEHRTAAQCAAMHGHDDCLRVIAECGGRASLSAVTDRAGSPAHCAAQEGHDETLRVPAPREIIGIK